MVCVATITAAMVFIAHVELSFNEVKNKEAVEMSKPAEAACAEAVPAVSCRGKPDLPAMRIPPTPSAPHIIH